MGIKFSLCHSNPVIYNNNHQQDREDQKSDYEKSKISFKIPLHYPRYSKSDYEKMPEWQLDQLLREYGLPIIGDSYEKSKFAIGAFVWSTENGH